MKATSIFIKVRVCTASILFIAGLSTSLTAISDVLQMPDVLEVPIGQQAKDKQSIDRPAKGMNKQQVEAIFGAPITIAPATGEPPISSWNYENFVVYFEYSFVIHTVLRHTPTNLPEGVEQPGTDQAESIPTGNNNEVSDTQIP